MVGEEGGGGGRSGRPVGSGGEVTAATAAATNASQGEDEVRRQREEILELRRCVDRQRRDLQDRDRKIRELETGRRTSRGGGNKRPPPSSSPEAHRRTVKGSAAAVGGGGSGPAPSPVEKSQQRLLAAAVRGHQQQQQQQQRRVSARGRGAGGFRRTADSSSSAMCTGALGGGGILLRFVTCVVQLVLFVVLAMQYWAAFRHTAHIVPSSGKTNNHVHLHRPRTKVRPAGAGASRNSAFGAARIVPSPGQGAAARERGSNRTDGGAFPPPPLNNDEEDLYFDSGKKGDKLDPYENVAPRAATLLLNSAHNSSLLFRNRLKRVTERDFKGNLMLVAAVQKRHQCVEAIRRRHDEVLGPFLRRVVNSAARHVLLVDPAYHKNVGDHMISLGELEFFQRRGFGSGTTRSGSGPGTFGPVVQCNYCQAGPYVTSCADALAEYEPSQVARQTAVWHGGGNWGDLWRPAQNARIKSFSDLLEMNYTILGMPQSLYYREPQKAIDDADKIKEQVAHGLGHRATSGNVSYLDTEAGVAEAKERFILCWREVESYEKAQQLYPYAKHIIAPDIAFQLGPYAPQRPEPTSPLNVDVVFLLRGDKESVLAGQRDKATIRQMMSSIEGGEGLRFTIVDWFDSLRMFETKNYYFSDSSIRLVSLGRVVVCDRLHAAILLYLTGIPFVYIDQVSGKITKTLNVAFDSLDGCKDGERAMWAKATNMAMAVELAVGFLHKYQL